MMLRRIEQFVFALRAEMRPEDDGFVQQYLPERLWMLFAGMSVIDRCHALRVAHTALVLAESRNDVDKELLIRCALLHDVGRQKDDMGLAGKIAAVLCNFFFSGHARKKASPSGNWWQRLWYIYYWHPYIGARHLSDLGFAIEADIISHHHDIIDEPISPELELLCMADRMN